MADVKLNDLSLLDIIEEILKSSEEAVSIYDLIESAAKAKDIKTDDVEAMTQLYMDITLSGRFVFVGDDKWSLKDGNLEFWDKDGYAFIQPEEAEETEDDEIDFSDFILEDVEAEDEDDYEDEDLDEEVIEEQAYEDVGLDLQTTDEDEGLDDVDLEIEEAAEYDEDDYNEIMDDYEDMYDK